MLRKQLAACYDVLRKTLSDNSGEVWNMRGAQLKGTDLAGNEFWEAPPREGSNRKTCRSLRVLDEPRSMGGRRKFESTSSNAKFGRSGLSVEWTSWLQHRRRDPPTMEELLRNVEKSARVADNVEKLRVKDEAVSAVISAWVHSTEVHSPKLT
eukprot:scpid96532/ scgid1876/ 